MTFLPRDAMLARYMLWPCVRPFVCLFVRLSVRHKPAFCQNGTHFTTETSLLSIPAIVFLYQSWYCNGITRTGTHTFTHHYAWRVSPLSPFLPFPSIHSFLLFSVFPNPATGFGGALWASLASTWQDWTDVERRAVPLRQPSFLYWAN